VAAKPTVSVNIRGKEFRVVGDEDVESLQRVAGYLDETLASVAKRTGIVDSLDISLLTGLNLARELVRIREGRVAGASGATADQLRELTDSVEAALAETRANPD
jgi:cell division protein ZapA (FtsZ GTPase activity inhibitor)